LRAKRSCRVCLLHLARIHCFCVWLGLTRHREKSRFTPKGCCEPESQESRPRSAPLRIWVHCGATPQIRPPSTASSEACIMEIPRPIDNDLSGYRIAVSLIECGVAAWFSFRSSVLRHSDVPKASVSSYYEHTVTIRKYADCATDFAYTSLVWLIQRAGLRETLALDVRNFPVFQLMNGKCCGFSIGPDRLAQN
jgi:hypothetical protein